MSLAGAKKATKKKAPAKKKVAKKTAKKKATKKGAAPAPASIPTDSYPGVENPQLAQEVRDMRDDFVRWMRGFGVRNELTAREFVQMAAQLGAELQEVGP